MFDNFDTDKPHLSLTKEAYTVLLNALDKLRKQVLSGAVIRMHASAGICYHWTRLVRRCHMVPYDLVPHLAERWEHTTRPGLYTSIPVPDDLAHGKWEGPNLVMRLHLMTYMRKRLRDLRRRAPDEVQP